MTQFRKITAFGSALLISLVASVSSVFAQPTRVPVPTDSLLINTPRYGQLNDIRPSNVVSALINFLLGVAGIVAFVFLLWGGIQWIMSGGDKEGTEKARKKLTAALVGLALVFSVYAMLYIIRVLFQIDLIQVDLSPIHP